MTDRFAPYPTPSFSPALWEFPLSFVLITVLAGFPALVINGAAGRLVPVSTIELAVVLVGFTGSIIVATERHRYERLLSFITSLVIYLSIISVLGAIPAITYGGIPMDSTLAEVTQVMLVVSAYVLALYETFSTSVRKSL